MNDTIGMKIDLDPCNEEGAKLSLDVTEKEHGIDYTLVGISAGESKNIPIPGTYNTVQKNRITQTYTERQSEKLGLSSFQQKTYATDD